MSKKKSTKSKNIQLPAPQDDSEWQDLLRKIDVDLEATAAKYGALLRHRDIDSAQLLLRLVLVYSHCDWPVNMIGAWGATKGLCYVSRQDIYERLRKCHDWVSHLVGSYLVRTRRAFADRKVRIRINDATGASRPGSTGTDWRVHLALDLQETSLCGVEITDAKGGETLLRHPTEPGEKPIEICDRGYCQRPGIGKKQSEGAVLLLRVNPHNLPLHTIEGERLDMLAFVRGAPADGPWEREAWVHSPSGVFPLRLICRRLSEEAANRARQRVREQASKKGRTPQEATLEMAGFMILACNLPSEEWSATQVLEMYRVRWQVELAIKRMKSVFNLDGLRTKDPQLGQVYLLGKILMQLLTDKSVRQILQSEFEWAWSVEQPVSMWAVHSLLKIVLTQIVRGVITMQMVFDALPILGRYIRDSPRKRQQQLALARNLLLRLNAA